MNEPARTSTLLPAEPTSPGEARRFVTREMEQAGCDGEIEIVTLLTNELVTNSVLHAGTTIEVCIDVTLQRVRVEIGDESPVLPVTLDVTEDAVAGRGLALVEELSDRWGVEHAPPGKRVWFEVTR